MEEEFQREKMIACQKSKGKRELLNLHSSINYGGWWVVLFLVGFLGGWWVVFVLWWGDGLCCSFCFFLGFCGLALVFPMYTACVLRGALRFH
jgi:uncharacterized membrane protein YjjP (DUF1212 family)